MSRKPDTAAALASILSAKRGVDLPAVAASPPAEPAKAEMPVPPSPALPPPAPSPLASAPKKTRSGKSSDKANYSQYSLYLRKDTRKKVGRALDDAEAGQDFSELVQELLEQWLVSRT
jgi:hypothetical protein